MINYFYKTRLKIVVLIFSVFSFSATAQDVGLEMLNIVNMQLQNADELHFFKGKIELKNNTTITGNIGINAKRYGKYYTVVRTKDSCNYILNEEINAVYLYETQKGVATETKFEALEEGNKLYRRIFHNEKRNVTVYDTSVVPFRNRLAYGVFVKDKGVLTYTHNFWTSGPKKDLINYINKRDKTKYKRRDFKTLQDLFAKV